MLFTSYAFIPFFLIVVLVSRALSNWTARKAFLLVASYLFYAAWNPPFVILLWISTLIDWHVAKRIDRSQSTRVRRSLLLVTLLVNLGLLGYFKYFGFLVGAMTDLLAAVNVNVTFAGPDIILPVGISFYTFQTLSTLLRHITFACIFVVLN